MKKRIALGMFFLLGILWSPTLATQGIDRFSNCAFRLPHTLDELLAIQQQLHPFQNAHLNSRSQNAHYITGVNHCTNRLETLKVETIEIHPATLTHPATLEVTGKVTGKAIGAIEQPDSSMTQRQIRITRPVLP